MKVIIVSTRYFGDCLLSAALSVAIKSEIPDALVDILTFCGNETILENISSIDHVITMPKNILLVKNLGTLCKNAEMVNSSFPLLRLIIL